ncbi:hypothetical protein MKEN_00490700 [Mycena kentingensis (nom. inval.)]|nr:hypothetical protein MKEN_00490700 [Mycena kentingensis (nom. inval.)]
MSMRYQAKDNNEAELPSTPSFPAVPRLSPPSSVGSMVEDQPQDDLEHLFNEELYDRANSVASPPVESIGASASVDAVAQRATQFDETPNNAPALPLLEYTNEHAYNAPAFELPPLDLAMVDGYNGTNTGAGQYQGMGRDDAPVWPALDYTHGYQYDCHYAFPQRAVDPSYNAPSAGVFEQLATHYFPSLPIEAASPAPFPPPLTRMARSPPVPPQDTYGYSNASYTVHNDDYHDAGASSSSQFLVPVPQSFAAPHENYHHQSAHIHGLSPNIPYSFPTSPFTLRMPLFVGARIPPPVGHNVATPSPDEQTMYLLGAGEQNLFAQPTSLALNYTYGWSPAAQNHGPYMHGPQGNAIAGPSNAAGPAPARPRNLPVVKTKKTREPQKQGVKRRREPLPDTNEYRYTAHQRDTYIDKLVPKTYECCWPCSQPSPYRSCTSVDIDALPSKIPQKIASHMGAAHIQDGDANQSELGQFKGYSTDHKDQKRRKGGPEVHCRWPTSDGAVCGKKMALEKMAEHIYKVHVYSLPCARVAECGGVFTSVDDLRKHMDLCGEERPPPEKKQRRK